MDLTAERVTEAIRQYPEVQPLAAVEAEHVEMLPDAFASGDYGWRTAEWVVQWYYRRFLGGYPDADRRATEDAYGENSYEAVENAVSTAVEAEPTAEKLHALTALDGVDVPVASAFLAFALPDRYVVLGEREWAVLRADGALADAYPDRPSARAYERYLDACRRVADRCDVGPWDLYRAMWVLGREPEASQER